MTFSKYFVQSCKDKDFVTTAVHELGHVLYWQDSHKGQWKVFAERMNKKYGLNVSRVNLYTNDDGMEIVQANSMATNGKEYILRCKECGKLIVRHRMSRVVEHPEMFRHDMDNGKLERIK